MALLLHSGWHTPLSWCWWSPYKTGSQETFPSLLVPSGNSIINCPNRFGQALPLFRHQSKGYCERKNFLRGKKKCHSQCVHFKSFIRTRARSLFHGTEMTRRHTAAPEKQFGRVMSQGRGDSSLFSNFYFWHYLATSEGEQVGATSCHVRGRDGKMPTISHSPFQDTNHQRELVLQPPPHAGSASWTLEQTSSGEALGTVTFHKHHYLNSFA